MPMRPDVAKPRAKSRQAPPIKNRRSAESGRRSLDTWMYRKIPFPGSSGARLIARRIYGGVHFLSEASSRCCDPLDFNGEEAKNSTRSCVQQAIQMHPPWNSLSRSGHIVWPGILGVATGPASRSREPHRWLKNGTVGVALL